MKKSQVAIIGFSLTLFLLVVVLILFYPQLSSLFAESYEFKDLRADAQNIVNVLYSEGTPP
jgi:hypothetical protein